MTRSSAFGRLAATGIVLAAAVAVLWAVPSSSYLLLPDRAKPLEKLVDVEGERKDGDGGGIYYVDVIVRKASLLERVVPGLREDGSALLPESALRPPGVSESERRRHDRRRMTQSQRTAAAVALRALGYDVVARPAGALILAVATGTPAADELEATQVIEAVDGERVRGPSDLRRLVRTRRPGDDVRLRVREGTRVRQVTVATVPDPDDGRRPVIGVQVEQAAEIRLPVDVRIDLGNVGGPSAGLAFALDLVEELRGGVDRGYRIAATGEIDLAGNVGPIGGVRQKAIGARRSGVDVFVVPAGDNAREAARYGEGLHVIAVRTFQQALRALATLPPKA